MTGDFPMAASAAARLRTLRESRDADEWHRWAMRALLVLGGGHFLAGVVFFFAYNWAELSSFAKFALLETAIVGSAALALLLRLDRPAGQAALIAASVFTGVLLAVIGQTYQTGADAWQLFAVWTLLITPWALGSRNDVHAFLWAVIMMTAASLYAGQRLLALDRYEEPVVVAALAFMPLGFLALREAAVLAGAHWLAGDWLRRTLVVLGVGALFMPAIAYVFGEDNQLPGFWLYLVSSAVMAAIYVLRLPDFSVLAVLAGFGTLFGMAAGGRVIGETIKFGVSAGSLVFSLLLLGGWCALLTAGCVKLLRRLHGRLATGNGNDG